MKTIVRFYAFCFFYLGLFQSQAQQASCICADVALPQPLTSGMYYPSAIADAENTALYLDYQVPYGLWELAMKKADFVWAMERAGIGLSVMQSGFDAYQHRLGSAMIGHRLGEVRAGLRANFHQLAILGQENANGLSLDASVYMPLTKDFYIGASMKNILQQSWVGERNGELPSEITLGIAQKPFDGLLWQLAVQKDMKQSPAVLAGLQYSWGKYLFANFNYQSYPGQIDLGFGFKNKHWGVLFSASRHYILGFSQRLLLRWSILKPNK